MTYILDFLYQLGLLAQTSLLNSILLIIGLINIVIIRALYKYKKRQRKSINYKINYFIFNDLCICIYVIVFITFILIIRYIRWGYTFDLKEYSTKVIAFITKVPLLMSCNIILILIICMLLWLLFRKFLHKEIIKRHLYIYYTSKYNTTKEHCKKYPGEELLDKDQSLYVIWSIKLGGQWSVHEFHDRVVYDSLTLPYYILSEAETSKKIKRIKQIFHFLLKRGPLILLVFLFFYDCIYNNFQIQLVFYYMPIYFVYRLWENASTWLRHTSTSLNMIIYDLYYMEYLKCYIGLTKEQNDFIVTYLQRGLRDYQHDLFSSAKTVDEIDIKLKEVEALIYFVQTIVACVYVPEVYKNYSTGDIIYRNVSDFENSEIQRLLAEK